MGGTSHRYQPGRRRRGGAGHGPQVGGHRIALNSLDIASIGAGGGSIARVDAGGILHVGPESAGAMPGPACYGQGGTRRPSPTPIWCSAISTRTISSAATGGSTARRPSAPSTAIAGALGIDRLAAAHGIHRIINTTWPRGCGSSRCGAASIRAASRCSRSAARPGCTRPTSRASSGSRGSSCRASRRCCRPGACWRPISASRCRARHIGDAGALDGAAVKHLFDEMEAEACAGCAPRSPGRRAPPFGRYALWRAGVRDHRAAR